MPYTDFLTANSGRSESSLLNAGFNQESQGLGPGPRYVLDPANPENVIDMRHFIVVGRMGEFAGLAIEVNQGLGADTRSAFDGQDFFSNELGSEFRSGLNSKTPIMDQLKSFFMSREIGPIPAPNQTGTAPSDASKVILKR